jgi:hypothetical protein
MHSPQQPSYAERDGYRCIGLGLDGIFQRPLEAAGGFAGRLRRGIDHLRGAVGGLLVNLLRCVSCIVGDASRIFLFFASPKARPKVGLEALASAIGISLEDGCLLGKVPPRHSFPLSGKHPKGGKKIYAKPSSWD